MTFKLECQIFQREYSYSIVFENNIFDQENGIEKHFLPYGKNFAIIADDIVAALYGQKLFSILLSFGFNAKLFTFAFGEASKTRKTKEQIEDALYAKKFDKDFCIIALGGGVTTDLAGFVAATYCRGVPLIMMPTSLLSMVDASIGGKCGVNHCQAKNRIGSIYQPKKVIIDVAFLKTLSKEHCKNGFVEMIKHAIIADGDYFCFLEQNVNDLVSLHVDYMEKAVHQSCIIKANIVKDDEQENGKRRLLNFGHTVGHALESLDDYHIFHGEAVAIGMLAEAHMAMQLGLLEAKEFFRIEKILRIFEIALQLPKKYSLDLVLSIMARDKKSVNNLPRFVMLDKIGSCSFFDGQYCCFVEEHVIVNALKWVENALLCH